MAKIILFCSTVLLLLFCQTANAQNQARIYGKVLSDTSEFPVEGANIVVLEDLSIGTSTNEYGRYNLLIPHNREITIEVSCIGYSTQTYTVNVGLGKGKLLNIMLKQASITLPSFDVNERYSYSEGMEKISPKNITRFPGLNSSIEQMVKSAMFGASGTEMSSQYKVRGGSYDENLIYLNGIEIYRPFLIRSGQQEGLSFINPDLVSGVRFSSGGFEPCYGDKMSSVLDVHYRKPTMFGASISASLLGASGHVEGVTKNRKLAALLGIRYQSNGYVLRQMPTKGNYKPTFTDGQLLLTYTPSEKWELTLFGNYARNVYRLSPDSNVRRMGTIGGGTQEFIVLYHGQEVDAYQTVYAAFVAKYALNQNTDLRFLTSYFNSAEKETFDLEAMYSLKEVNSSFGDDDFGETKKTPAIDIGSDLHHARNFLTSHIFHGEFQGEHRLKRKNTLTWGVKFQGETIDDKLSEWRLYDSLGYSLPHIYPPIDSLGKPVPFTDSSRIISMGNNYLKTKNTLETFRLSGFVQDKWEFGDSNKFILVGGMRFYYWTFNHELIFTPRLRLIYQPNIKSDISFYFATGMYYQPAFYKEMRMPDGELNKNIKSQKSYHVILGMDYLFRANKRPFKFSTEVYYKHLQDLITYTMDNVRVIYSGKNDAVGHTVGIDAKLSGEIVHNLESWLSVSLMKSVEKIDGNNKFTPRPTDQRFSVNLFFQDRVPKLPMLKAHINFVYSTPLPASSPYIRNYIRTSHHYFRTDIGFSWQFVDETTRFGKKNPFRCLKGGYLTFEIANVFDYQNVLSYSWVSNLEGAYYMLPNYLTPRLFNVKLRFEF
ncbi:MAG: TonB-dependent receptor [Bacteroidales bacterium]|jgi:hypothetical protein|nr:TonB-dependent receptor [Bacteroidales bacterium]